MKCFKVLAISVVRPRGYHCSVTSLTSLWSRASHIIASDEDLGDAMNVVMTQILTKILHHDVCSRIHPNVT